MGVPDSEELVPDEIFEILSNHRRRMVLYYLRKHGNEAPVKELAAEIAAMENEVSVDELTSEQRKRVYVSLYQTHLPMLAELNVIDYDKEAGDVRLAKHTQNIDKHLSSETDSTYPWTAHYAILVFGGVLLIVLAAVGTPLLEALPILALGLTVLVSLGLSGIVQYWSMQKRNAVIPPELQQ